jgi:hypothetical protein
MLEPDARFDETFGARASVKPGPRTPRGRDNAGLPEDPPNACQRSQAFDILRKNPPLSRRFRNAPFRDRSLGTGDAPEVIADVDGAGHSR